MRSNSKCKNYLIFSKNHYVPPVNRSAKYFIMRQLKYEEENTQYLQNPYITEVIFALLLKLKPDFITNICRNKKRPIYSQFKKRIRTTMTISCSRNWWNLKDNVTLQTIFSLWMLLGSSKYKSNALKMVITSVQKSWCCRDRSNSSSYRCAEIIVSQINDTTLRIKIVLTEYVPSEAWCRLSWSQRIKWQLGRFPSSPQQQQRRLWKTDSLNINLS